MSSIPCIKDESLMKKSANTLINHIESALFTDHTYMFRSPLRPSSGCIILKSAVEVVCVCVCVCVANLSKI